MSAILDAIKAQSANRLAGRIALVTGASKGIGACVAKRFAAEGAHVILLGRDVKRLEAVDDNIQALGGQASIVPADLSDPEVPGALAAQINQRWGKLDVLVANAGMLGALSPVDHLNEADDWQKVFNLNLHANFRLLSTLNPVLRESGSGRVITLSSGAVTNPRAFWGAYAASKAALDALTISYALENQNFGICANILDPGGTRTEMRAEAKPGEDPLSLPTGDAIAHEFVRLASADCTDVATRVKAQAIDGWRELFG